MPEKKRYFAEDDLNRGVTAAGLKRLSVKRQKDYLLTWFAAYYEDPAQETPYNSGEGGYLYPWGGPYDARDELEAEFGKIVAPLAIESAVDEIESDGITEWAPGRNHRDHQRAAEEDALGSQVDDETPGDLQFFINSLQNGASPNYGGSGETEQRRIINEDIKQILELISSEPIAGVGHNKPPLDDESTDSEAFAEVSEAVTVIKDELAKPSPNALDTAIAATRLQKVADWLGKKLDVGAEGFFKKTGENLSTALFAVGGVEATIGLYRLGELISNVVTHTTQWLAHVISVF